MTKPLPASYSMGKTTSIPLKTGKKTGVSVFLLLFLILRGTLVVFVHLVWCWQWDCHIWPLLCLVMLPLFPLWWEFYHKWVLDFTKCFFCIYWYDHVVLILHFVYVVNHIYQFVNFVSTLHSWNKSHLIMMYNLFDTLLYSVCLYFVEYFSIYVHHGYWPIIFFLCIVFIWFWN